MSLTVERIYEFRKAAKTPMILKESVETTDFAETTDDESMANLRLPPESE